MVDAREQPEGGGSPGSDKGSFSIAASDAGDAPLRPRISTFSDRPTVSGAKVALNIITGGLGTGILSLPWSTAGATLLPAIVIIALVLAVNAWTIRILVLAAERHNTFDLGGLLARFPGARRAKAAQALCNVTVWLSMFLCLVGYLVAISDSAERALGKGRVERRLLVIVATALVFPLSFLSQDQLAFTSSLCVGVNVYVFILLGVLLGMHASTGELEAPCMFNVGRGTIAMVTAMMQSVIIQMCVLPMYEELENRSPRKFDKVIAVAFAVLFVLFSVFSVAGQTLYGLGVESNILKNLPRNTAGLVAQCGMVIAIAGVYPIMLMPMVAPVRGAGYVRMAKPVTAVIVVATLGVACICDDLGFLNVINGALSLGVFVGLIPALVGIVLLGMWKFALVALAVVSFVVSVLGFVYTQNYAEDNAGGQCRWHG